MANQTYTVTGGQTLLGLALQLYGNSEAIKEILLLNDLTGKMDNGAGTTDEVDLSANIIAGTEIIYDDASALRNSAVLAGLAGRIFIDKLPRVYLAETHAVVELMATKGYDVPEFEKNALDDMIYSLKTGSLWTKIKCLYPMMGASLGTCAINAKDPRDLDAAFRITFVNAPTADLHGVSWNGTNQYAVTHFIPSASGFADLHHGYYSLTETITNGRIEMAVQTGSTISELHIRPDNTRVYTPVVSTTSAINYFTRTPIASTGLFLACSSGATVRLHQNGVSLGTVAQPDGNIANLTTKVGLATRLNSNSPTAGTYSVLKCGFATIGNTLSESEGTTYSSIINTFMTAVGRNTY